MKVEFYGRFRIDSKNHHATRKKIVDAASSESDDVSSIKQLDFSYTRANREYSLYTYILLFLA